MFVEVTQQTGGVGVQGGGAMPWSGLGPWIESVDRGVELKVRAERHSNVRSGKGLEFFFPPPICEEFKFDFLFE